MTHRLYTNEYSKELVYQLSHNAIDGLLCTDESTEGVLVISGELDDLQKLSSLMYVEDEAKIKAVLPGFIATADTERDVTIAFEEVSKELTNSLLKVINKNFGKTSYSLYGNEKYKALADMFEIMEAIRK